MGFLFYISCYVFAITRVSNVESLLYTGNVVQHHRYAFRTSAAKSNSGFGENNRRRTEEKRSSEPPSPTKKGFGSSGSSKSAVSSNEKKLIDPGTVIKGTSQQNMEATIQKAIDTNKGLREMMTLQSELDDCKISMSFMNDADKSRTRIGKETMHILIVTHNTSHPTIFSW